MMQTAAVATAAAAAVVAAAAGTTAAVGAAAIGTTDSGALWGRRPISDFASHMSWLGDNGGY